MHYRKVLFYYSVFVSTALFIWIILYLPRPQSLIPLFLLLPIAVHFWLGIVHPHKTKAADDEDRQSKKDSATKIAAAVLATLFISAASILVYSLAYEKYSPIIKTLQNKSSTDTNLSTISKQINSISAENQDLKRQINKLYQESLENKTPTPSIANTLGALTDKEASPTGVIKITSKTHTSIYKSSSINSQVVGDTTYNKLYSYTQKIPGWYYISFDNLKQGWVIAQYATEL